MRGCNPDNRERSKAQALTGVKPMKRFTCASLGVAALSFLAPSFAHAATFFIEDARADDYILFSANDFEGGITINGQLLQQGINNPGSLLLPEADATGQSVQFNFNGTWQVNFAPLPTLPHSAFQVIFEEPGTQVTSDILYGFFKLQQEGFWPI